MAALDGRAAGVLGAAKVETEWSTGTGLPALLDPGVVALGGTTSATAVVGATDDGSRWGLDIARDRSRSCRLRTRKR